MPKTTGNNCVQLGTWYSAGAFPIICSHQHAHCRLMAKVVQSGGYVVAYTETHSNCIIELSTGVKQRTYRS